MKASKILTALIISFAMFCTYSYGQKTQNTAGPERRLALVIGNAAYLHSPALANPVNDARSMRTALQALGFDVFEYEDVNQSRMKEAIDNFGNKLKNYSVGLFFYSGHGIQSKGANYLIPIDANIQSEQQIEYDCVQADRVLGFMEAAGSKVNIVILDACRNNPFERSWSRAVEGTGLAFMNAPTGSLIAYSTSPGRTASDGSGSNGLYTAALLENMKTPDITILQMFQNVRRSVSDNSYKAQIPWESTSLTNDFYFVNKAAVSDKVDIRATWKKDSTDGFWFYVNDEDASTRQKNSWSGDDLLVYDPFSNMTCLFEKFSSAVPFKINNAKILGTANDTYWKAKDGSYFLYYKGDQIAKRTNNTYVDKDLLVYDPELNNTFILKDYKANNDSKLRPAVLLSSADYAFWKKQADGSYFLYVKGDGIQGQTRNGFIEKDLIVYDTINNITYRLIDYDNPDNVQKLMSATVVSYQDNLFWQKVGTSYYFINRGKAIQHNTTSEWKGDDLYVTDKTDGKVYIFPNYAHATQGVLNVAIRN
ncbi:MAG: caspase domain-containing protein [Bacteroidales bacterium]